MPVNFLKSPDGSPLKMVELNAPTSATYHTVQFNKDWFAKSIKAYQVKRDGAGKPLDYAQKWQLTDLIRPQIAVPVARLVVAVIINCSGAIVANVNYNSTVVAGDLFRGTQCERYQFNFTPSSLSIPAGRYWLLISVSNEPLDSAVTFKEYISEPLEFRASWPHTVFLEYSNLRNDYDLRFDMVRRFGLRVDANIADPTFTFEDSDFIDQQQNGYKLYSGKYKDYEITFGSMSSRHQSPLPAWMFDKITEALRCNRITIDGKQFFRPNNATIDVVKLGNNYPLSNGTITLRGVNEQDNAVHGAGVISHQFPLTYPFMLTLNMYGGGDLIYLAQNVVIDSQADINTLITNAAGSLDGTLVLDTATNLLTYTIGASEGFNTFGDYTLLKQFTYAIGRAGGNQIFEFLFSGGVSGVSWGDGQTERIGLGNPAVVNAYAHNYLTGATRNVRIFHNNNIQTLGVLTPANGFKVTGISGTIPTSIESFQIYRQSVFSITAGIFSPFQTKLPIIQNLVLASNGTAAIGNIDFTGNVLISNIDFSGNSLSVANVNQLLFGFWDPGDYRNGGYFSIRQSPSAAPTGTALTAKSSLQASGWAVDTN